MPVDRWNSNSSRERNTTGWSVLEGNVQPVVFAAPSSERHGTGGFLEEGTIIALSPVDYNWDFSGCRTFRATLMDQDEWPDCLTCRPLNPQVCEPPTAVGAQAEQYARK